MSNTRFDLEQAILKCWNVTEDLKLVSDLVTKLQLDTPEHNQLLTAINGLALLYEVKFEQAFNLFEQLLKEQVTKVAPHDYSHEYDDFGLR